MEHRRPVRDFFPEAIRQIRAGWIPALLAVLASSLIARLGSLTFIGLLLGGAAVLALRRYRLILERREAER